jgi:uncharacterized protein YgfB (UPF0149 family)
VKKSLYDLVLETLEQYANLSLDDEDEREELAHHIEEVISDEVPDHS